MTNDAGAPRVLHAIVGHKLPTYFINVIKSVRQSAPNDDLLVVDNASDLPAVDRYLSDMGDQDPRVKVIRRHRNDLSRNGKVGGLYDAYAEIVAHALESGYDLLHLVQGDMQMLWWDDAIVERALQLYAEFPTCINIVTAAMLQDRRLSDDVAVVEGPLLELPRYGLTDTGLYHLGRWQEYGIRFHDSEQQHAEVYRRQGHRVLCHPWPAVAPVPWPAVIRKGRRKGREVRPPHAQLLRPLTVEETRRVREADAPVWLEDVSVPWGWTCLTPMAETRLESIEYWVFRYRDFRSRGWSARPRWARAGIEPGRSLWAVQRRPALWQLAVLPPWYELKRRLSSE